MELMTIIAVVTCVPGCSGQPWPSAIEPGEMCDPPGDPLIVCVRAQTGLEYYFDLQPLTVFQVADQVYGLNLNSLQAVLLQPDAMQARTSQHSYLSMRIRMLARP